MAYTYQAPVFSSFPGFIVETIPNGNAYIPCDLENRDYQTFLAWVAEPGNTAPEGWTGPTNPAG